MWKRLKHKNIVPLLCVIANPLQFISEWTHCGDLTEYIRNYPNENRLGLVGFLCLASDPVLNPPQLSGVAEGLYFLHSYDVVHGDLKGVCD